MGQDEASAKEGKLTPAQRSLRSMAANTRWAHEADRTAATKPVGCQNSATRSELRFLCGWLILVEQAAQDRSARDPLGRAPGDRWWFDETYIKVAGRWCYLYRAVDQFGQVIDVLATDKRDAAAARRFFTRALRQVPRPVEATTDRAPAYLGVLEERLPAARHVPGGERVSGLVVRRLARAGPSLNDEQAIRDALDECNRILYEAAAGNPELTSMGTTVAGVAVIPELLVAFDVGDSRVYQVVADGLQQVSVYDQPSVRGLLSGHIVTQTLGGHDRYAPVDAHLTSSPRPTDTCFLVCSDGLTDVVPTEALAEILHDYQDGRPRSSCGRRRSRKAARTTSRSPQSGWRGRTSHPSRRMSELGSQPKPTPNVGGPPVPCRVPAGSAVGRDAPPDSGEVG